VLHDRLLEEDCVAALDTADLAQALLELQEGRD
jgi:hypothetical protein